MMIQKIIKRTVILMLASLGLLFVGCREDDKSSIIEDQTPKRIDLNNWQACLPTLDTVLSHKGTRTFEGKEIGGEVNVKIKGYLKWLLGLDVKAGGWWSRKDSIGQVIRRENFMSEEFRNKYSEFRLCYCTALSEIPDECKEDSSAYYSYKLKVYNNCFENYQNLTIDFCNLASEDKSPEESPIKEKRRKKQGQVKKEISELKTEEGVDSKSTGQSISNIPKDLDRTAVNPSIPVEEKPEFDYRVVHTSASFIQVGAITKPFSIVNRLNLKLPAGKHEFLLLDEDRQVLSTLHINLPSENQKIIIYDNDYSLQSYK